MSDARTVIAAEIFRQYKANPHWDDAKQVVECLNHDAILAALAEAGLEIRKSVDLTKHYSWCCLAETECNCGGREGSE